MTNSIDRRAFLSYLSATGLFATAGPSLDDFCDLVLGSVQTFTPNPQESDERIFNSARRTLAFPTDVAFCNTGTLGASPREVMDTVVNSYRAAERELPEWAYRPNAVDDPLPPSSGYRPLERLRSEVGGIINAPVHEIAFTQNATMGMSFLANGLDLRSGDEIVTTDQEHPGGISPWLLQERRRGVAVKQVVLGPALTRGPEAVLELFADAITPRTRVVMFSHITSILGIKLPAQDLCALARERGALSVVDGAQAVGQIPVDVGVIGCDAYVTSTHKWMVAPKGTGLLYIKAASQDNFWSTLVTTGYDDRSTGAFRFMRFGTGSLPVVLGLVAAARFIARLGLERIARWDQMLTNQFREGLAKMPHVRVSSPLAPQFTAAMTTFTVAGHSSDQVQNALWARKIRVRAEGDAGVRLSAHFYVAPADIERALGVIRGMA